MKPFLLTLCLVAALLLTNSLTFGQGGNGRGTCLNNYMLSYYKVRPGHYDEWMELFRKWHLPVVEYDVAAKSLADYKFFAASGHAIDPDFDFAGMYVFYGTPQSYDGERLSRPALIVELFGDQMDDYIAGEKRRWELTEKHWDTRFTQMDPHQEPFSVFHPIFTDCEQTTSQ